MHIIIRQLKQTAIDKKQELRLYISVKKNTMFGFQKGSN